jgi:hypothetical protein
MAKRWDFFERGDRAAKKLIWVVIAPERSWPMKLGEEKKEPDRAQLLFLRARWTDWAITLVRPGGRPYHHGRQRQWGLGRETESRRSSRAKKPAAGRIRDLSAQLFLRTAHRRRRRLVSCRVPDHVLLATSCLDRLHTFSVRNAWRRNTLRIRSDDAAAERDAVGDGEGELLGLDARRRRPRR